MSCLLKLSSNAIVKYELDVPTTLEGVSIKKSHFFKNQELQSS